MKLFTTTLLAASLCLGTVFPADAGNTVGTVKAWQYMQADGWRSADKGEGCYFAIIDNQSSARYEAEQSVLYSYPKVDNIDNELAKVRQKFSPQVVTVIPDNCVNKQQQAALAAKRSEEDRKLEQWVAQQSLAELCRRTGNC